jgi:hypothetical protein
MNKEEFFQLKLSESKDLLSNINNSIKETRNRIYFLIALVFAIFSYCIEDLINLKYFSSKSLILYSVILFSVYIFYQCRLAITPLKLRFNGISPNNFDLITDKDESKTKVNILYTYQRSIEVNGDHLQMISRAYNKAFYSLITWVFFVFCLFALQGVVKCYV